MTSIEVDPQLAAQARATLERAGYGEVTVITGDGTQGCPVGASFDRVLSTVAAPQVPYAWVAQTRPGGVVVTPWGSAFKPAGLLSLTVQPDHTATGSLVNTTISFMELRDQRIPRPAITELVHDPDTPDVSFTKLHASHLCSDEDALFAIGLQVPGCHWEYPPSTANEDCWCVWFLDAGSGSWARFDYQPGTHGVAVLKQRSADRYHAPTRLGEEPLKPLLAADRGWGSPDCRGSTTVSGRRHARRVADETV